VEQVSKSQAASPALLKSLGLLTAGDPRDALPAFIPYCPFQPLESTLYKAIERIDIVAMVATSIDSCIARLKGRV
jgi:hypothetical protein